MSAAGKSKSLRGLTISRLQGRRQSATPIVQVSIKKKSSTIFKLN